MTTIAIDRMSIAADGRSTSGTEIVRDDIEKITIAHGRIYAIAGSICLFPAVVAWHHAGADPNKLPAYHGEDGWFLIVIQAEGIFCYTNKVPYALADEYRLPAAFGSGQHFALGAMLAGKTAREAVEIACRVDSGSGGNITSINIAEALAPKLKEAAE